MICNVCGIDPEIVSINAEGMKVSGHGCHCVRENGKRIAVGICCGRTLGEELLTEEDASDEARENKKT